MTARSVFFEAWVKGRAVKIIGRYGTLINMYGCSELSDDVIVEIVVRMRRDGR